MRSRTIPLGFLLLSVPLICAVVVALWSLFAELGPGAEPDPVASLLALWIGGLSAVAVEALWRVRPWAFSVLAWLFGSVMVIWAAAAALEGAPALALAWLTGMAIVSVVILAYVRRRLAAP